MSTEGDHLLAWRQEVQEATKRHAEHDRALDAGADFDAAYKKKRGIPGSFPFAAKPSETESDGLSVEQRRLLHDGRRAWQSITRDFSLEAWRAVGAALAVGRTIALQASGSNKANGGRYTRAFAAWCAEQKIFTDMSKSTRAWALVLHDNAAPIVTWWMQLPATKRNRLCQPQSIIGAWRAATIPPKPVDTLRNARSAWRKLRRCLEGDERALALLDELWTTIESA